MVSPRIRKLAAILIGLALAGVPAAAAYVWLGRYVEQQAVRELDVTARRVIGLAEQRLAVVVDALDDLAGRGLRSCADADRDSMHETSFRIVPIKELSVVGPDGDTHCTNLAIPLGQRRAVATIENRRPDVVIEVIRIGKVAESVVRIRRATADGFALAALVPTDLLLPRTSSDGGPHVVHATLTTSDGTVLGERAAQDTDIAYLSDLLTVRVRAEHFGMFVTTSMPRVWAHGQHGDLAAIVTIGSGVSAAFALMLAAFGPWRRRDDPVADLARAIRNGEFVPYYQPIVDLTTARVVSAEVLVRWRKPNGKLVPPVHFIPLAESSGLIVELTRVLMRRVCADAGPMIGARRKFQIGFNLSARHFMSEDVVEDVRTIFAGSPIALNQVLLEVTEREALGNLTMARRVIASLQGLGVHVGIDDLGTGHSGLSYMLKLGVDFIKIDKMFVDAIDTERYSTTIIETLVGLARDMRMEIIAEGVETFEQVQHLRARGIRKAQGYVFAPPLPGPSFLKLLEAADPAPAREAPLAEQPIEADVRVPALVA